MKVSKEVAARHRQALLEAAGRLFRDKGFDQVGIAEIAAASGLTHGAFYTHFASKEALCAEVIEAMIARTADMARGSSDLRAYIDAYLSPRHVQDRAGGCPLAALGCDAGRGSEEVKAAFSRGFEQVVDARTGGRADRRQRAIARTATLIGGLLLARAAAKPELRDEILEAVKSSL